MESYKLKFKLHSQLLELGASTIFLGGRDMKQKQIPKQKNQTDTKLPMLVYYIYCTHVVLTATDDNTLYFMSNIFVANLV